MAVLTGGALMVAIGVLAWMLGIVGGDDDVPAAAGGSTALPTPPTSAPLAAPVTPEPTIAPATNPSTTPAPTTTVAAVVDVTTTITPPSTSTTSSTSSTSTTSSTTTTTTSTTTVPDVVGAGGPMVAIVGYTGPCKFGNDCLIADFSIQDFDAVQREFVCEFEDGSRYTFRFDGAGAERACATSASNGSITIEVGGVRSEAVSR